jgi:EAL domain-containing protein (putative c-di-GMP-specific phosphodiesterase class I)
LLPLLDKILTKYPLKPYTLTLEITESMLIKNIQVTCNLLEQIKSKNITISIDDFGTGYSCFSYLHKLPIDSLKIDRSFVNISQLNSQNLVIAESIITLSQSLGLKTIAEGVETEEQCNWLKTLNCHFAQGYFFSRPVDSTAATNLLEQLPPCI